jgi:SP family general alpha glucoside:H+ symporter-like MFS transporter
MACLVLISGFITIFFCAPNIQTLQAAEVLAGIPWGVFQTRKPGRRLGFSSAR